MDKIKILPSYDVIITIIPLPSLIITLYRTTHPSTYYYYAIIITSPLALFTDRSAMNFVLTRFHTQYVHTTPL